MTHLEHGWQLEPSKVRWCKEGKGSVTVWAVLTRRAVVRAIVRTARAIGAVRWLVAIIVVVLVACVGTSVSLLGTVVVHGQREVALRVELVLCSGDRQ